MRPPVTLAVGPISGGRSTILSRPKEAVIAIAARVAGVAGHRRILWLLVGRDLKIRYSRSALGYLWTVLDPLLMSLVYWFIFTKIFSGRQVGARPYLVYLLLGMLVWHWASGVINGATKALTAEAKIVRSANIVREVWVLRIVGAKFAEFVFSLPVLLLFVLLYYGKPGSSLEVTRLALLVPVALVLQIAATTGIGLILAPLTVLYNDVQRLVPIFLRILFYMTPVLYDIHNVPKQLRPYYSFNPFAGILDAYRSALFPNQFAGWGLLGASAVGSLTLLGLGLVTFRRLEGRVLKEL